MVSLPSSPDSGEWFAGVLVGLSIDVVVTSELTLATWGDGMWEVIQLGHHYATTRQPTWVTGYYAYTPALQDLGTSRLVLSPENYTYF